MLSRLVLRLKPGEILDAFDFALGLYNSRQRQVLSYHLIAGPLENLLKRTWQSLAQSQRTLRALDLLGSPIVGLDGYTAQIESRYPEPSDVLSGDSDSLLRGRTDHNFGQRKEVVSLLVRALRAGGEPRKRATSRLFRLSVNGFLEKAEWLETAETLWDPKFTSIDGLPDGTALYDWGFLVLPERSPVWRIGASGPSGFRMGMSCHGSP